jgi:hypothetical protein
MAFDTSLECCSTPEQFPIDKMLHYEQVTDQDKGAGQDIHAEIFFILPKLAIREYILH